MRKDTIQGTVGYFTGRRRRRRTWKKIVSVLACIVVFCTTYALILPAITMEGKAYCGLEAHQHSEKCYQETLICGQEETEATAHVHSAECYAAEEALQCGLEEGTAASGHAHTEECYEFLLLCEEEEHAHELRCYSNPEADVESAEVWERTLSDVTLTGDWNLDVVAVAKSQLGYQESEKNYEVGQDGETKKGYTRYGAWYGEPYGDWCAMFASFCLEYAGIPETDMPQEASCTRWVQKLTQAGRYQSEEYTPGVGDLVFFDLDADGASDHVGVVAELLRDKEGQIEKFKTIEGNADNRVQQATYELGEEKISGYAALPENPEAISETMPTETEPVETGNASETMPTETAPAETMPTETAPEAMGIAANGETLPPDQPTLQLGVQQDVEVGKGEIVKLAFVPEVTHEYSFAAKASARTYGYLYDANEKQLMSNSGGAFTYNLTAGKTYYYGVSYYNSGVSGTIPVLLSYGEHGYSIRNDEGKLTCACGAICPTSGTCGRNLQWSLEDGVLTISGQGSMYDYSNYTAPWCPYRKDIQSVVVEEGVTDIGNFAFYVCDLKDISFPTSVTSIGNFAFYSCPGLESIVIPETITEIGADAFSSCSKLKNVTIPESITEISYSTFSYCHALTSITIPKSVTVIRGSAFYDCDKLSSIVIPEGITKIENDTFYECSALTSVVIPESVTEIESKAFCSCSALESITIPDGVTTIGSSAFANCTKLKSIELPSGVSNIGNSAFSGCHELTSFTFPEGLTKLGNNCLSYCSKLSTIYWSPRQAVTVSSDFAVGKDANANVTVIVKAGSALLTDCFAGFAKSGYTLWEFAPSSYFTLSALKAEFLDVPVTAFRESRYYVDEFGVFYRIDQAGESHMAYCPAGLETYQVPRTLPPEQPDGAPVPVVGVDRYACYQATLSSLTFAGPEQITLLEDFAFYHASQLASINGQTEEQQALALFPNAAVGSQVFEDTQISRRITTTGEPLICEKDNLQLTIATKPGAYHNPAQDENGTFLYYTGETAQTTVTVSNPNSDAVNPDTVVRIFYRFDRLEGEINYEGIHEILSENGNKYKMTVSETQIPGCYCLELERPHQGDTINLVLESQYPTPTSGGGSATVWGGILTGAEAQALGEALLPITSSQRLYWQTLPDTFPITKKLSTTNGLHMVGDGKGHGTFSNLSYRISMSRAGNTLEGVGKDYMTDVMFEDVLTPPEGGQISEEVAAAIRNGTYSSRVFYENGYGHRYGFFTEDDEKIVVIRPSNTDYARDNFIKDGSLALNDKGELIVRWRFCNYHSKSSVPDTEIPSVSFTLDFEPGVVIIPQTEEGKIYTVHNEVTAEQHFMHSQDQHQQAACDASASISQAELQFSKDHKNLGSSNYKMGESIEFTLTAYNAGVMSYERLARITDPLPDRFYMTAEQLAALFASDSEGQVTVRISYATLCAPGERSTVTGIDGASTGTTTLQNTGSNTAYHGMETVDSDCVSLENATITLTWAEGGQIQISLDGGEQLRCAPTAAEIQGAFDKLGVVVTPKTKYNLSWNLTGADGKPRVLLGGGRVVKTFQATSKDTFMLLNHDQKYAHPNGSSTVSNTGYAYDQKGERLKYDSEGIRVDRDFTITKGWSWNGQTIDADTELVQGSVLDYSLTVTHQGMASYSALPLVDHMSGGQALLAPKALNEGAAWASTCPTVTAENGREYYILKELGIYSQVWTSEGQLADNVTVTRSDTGLDTVIKWYFVNYTGNRADHVAYQAMVCPKDALPGALAYSLGNETWLGDHQSHRLYNSLPGWGGVTFHFDKKIVKAVGDTAPGITSCPVHEGETIVYRLTLESGLDDEGNPVELTLRGNELSDALPYSVAGGRWSRDTVQLSYGEGYTIVNGDHWEVTDPDSDQQHIRWQDDFSITFRGTAHIYVTLTFPKEILWQEYARQYSATTLINTFRVLNHEVHVTHDLAIPGKVRLQKGVLSSSVSDVNNDSNDYMTRVNAMNGHADARFYYSSGRNSSLGNIRNYLVQYYASLYNGGTTKVYLNDMQDRLPQGFVAKLDSRNNIVSQIGTSNFTVYKEDGSQATLRTANCTGAVETTQDGAQRLRFHFSPVENNNASVHYDEKREMCYLNPGEAIVVVYQCYAGGADQLALNTVSMPYYNFNGAGVTVDTKSTTLVPQAERYTPNDGDCTLENNGQALNHGFTGGTNDTQWLTSEVTLTPGGIKPGITKALTSKTDVHGYVTQNPVSALSTDVLHWTIIAENDGNGALVDYTLTDTMQSPYMFTGDVHYSIYVLKANSSNSVSTYRAFNATLFTLEETSDPNKLSIDVTDGNPSSGTLEVNGALVHSNVHIKGDPKYTYELSVALTRDASGNVTLSIRLMGLDVSIPGGGRGTLTLSTRHATDTLENAQFVNKCYITPMIQVWDNTTNKGNMTTLLTPFAAEARPTVRNSAPVTTSYGYTTSSIKRITQTGNPANTAACTDEINYIVLESARKTFDYTLSVSNDTPNAMDKLILIDGLPEVGDHTAFLEDDPRFSAFKVSLAELPNFTVTVTDNASGAETVLDPANYQVQFSTATKFTQEDWNGTSAWSSDPTGARSIRLVIEDPTETMIPKENTVSLRFTCQIDGEAEPGTIAWNSFGYHYSLMNEAAELEAAPLKVGVKVPTVPKLKKQLVDHSGLPMAAEQDETFSFLLYAGAPLDGSFETEEALTQALTAAGKDFRKFTLTVPMGQSVSETISLKSEGWEWMNQQEYTIVELPGSEEYGFRRFDLSPTVAYRFTYLCAEEKVITCENTSLRWDVALTKQDPTGATLAGAVFALYSPDAGEQIAEIPAEYASLNVQKEIQRGESAWYLAGVGTTGTDGTLRWNDLLQERYYLAELKTPDGYHLPDGDGWRLLESKRETQGVYAVTVFNVSEHEMPETGSVGSGSYTTGGLLLIAGAGILLLYRKKRRGKEVASSS